MRNSSPSATVEAMISGLRLTMPMQQISTRTGLSSSHLYRLACGDISRPSYDTVERLQRLEKLTRQVQPAAALPKRGGLKRPGLAPGR